MKKTSVTYHHGNLRNSVIESAKKILEKEGLKALTLRRLAKDIGVSQNAPYAHFQGKSELLDAVAAVGFDELVEFMEVCARGVNDPAGYLQKIGEGYVLYAHRNPAMFRLMFDFRNDRATPTEALADASANAYRLVNEAIINIQKRSPEPGEMPKIATLGAWSMVHGLSVLLTEGKLGGYPELEGISETEVVERILAIFVRGVAGSG